MRIELITPAPPTLNNGNKITALRWAQIFRQLGHKVELRQLYGDARADVLIALHARRSYPSIEKFHRLYPALPLIVVLTGTDLYRDIRTDDNAKRSLDLATRLVALQKMALVNLPKRFHSKTRIIYQSAKPYRARASRPRKSVFQICLIAHLREEKDPLRAALAVQGLPAQSRIQLIHIGLALDPRLEKKALTEAARNARYRWLGEQPHWKTRQILAESDLVVITSRMEGSSNVLSEALASSVPVIAAKIPGLIGTLGKTFPGYFPVGNTRRLTALLRKAESDKRFYRRLKRYCAGVSPLVRPERELAAWRSLIREIRETKNA